MNETTEQKKLLKGRILKAISGFYYVKVGGMNLYECRASGLFRKKKLNPLVGDIVDIEDLGEFKGYIVNICKRKNSLVRPAIANIDNLFIISSAGYPKLNTFIIDKLIAISEKNEIEPIIVFNKSDIEPLDGFVSIYRKAGFNSFLLSCKEGTGRDKVIEYAKGKVSAFCGNTGVGKSSIINLINSELSVETGDVSLKLGRGRHTTRHTEIYEFEDNTFIADSPGFSALETDKLAVLFKEELQDLFREFKLFYSDCKFADCSHTGEKGCAVKAAVESGKISKSRYESYQAMFEESKQLKEWQLK